MQTRTHISNYLYLYRLRAVHPPPPQIPKTPGKVPQKALVTLDLYTAITLAFTKIYSLLTNQTDKKC